MDLRRIVEPGEISVMAGASSRDIQLRGSFQLVGELRPVGHERVLVTPGDGDASQVTERRP